MSGGANEAGQYRGRESFALISLPSATPPRRTLALAACRRHHTITEISPPVPPGTCACPGSCFPTGQGAGPEAPLGDVHACPWASGCPAARDGVSCTQGGSSAGRKTIWETEMKTTAAFSLPTWDFTCLLPITLPGTCAAELLPCCPPCPWVTRATLSLLPPNSRPSLSGNPNHQ